MNDTTPLVAQYRQIKSKYVDCVLLFRVGDFYETFFEDAIDISQILNIALTTRDKKKPNPIPLAGVPFHAAETYITRLLAAGRKVAICEQVEDAALAKGLVRREVVEVLTPGTALNQHLLESRENNFCLALEHRDARAGVAVVDVSTGDLFLGETEWNEVAHLLQGKRIREVVCRRGTPKAMLAEAGVGLSGALVVEVDDAFFEDASVDQALRAQFPGGQVDGSANLSTLEKTAAGALLAHLHSLKGRMLAQVVGIKRLGDVQFLAFDEETARNLELFEPLHGGSHSATLINVIDRTMTAMGGREIRAWLQKPLCDVERIEARADAVAEVYADGDLQETLTSTLGAIRDVQRVAARIASRKAIPREFHAVRESLEKIPDLRRALESCRSHYLVELRGGLNDHQSVVSRIESAIVEDPPGHLREGGVIRKGFSPVVDQVIEQSDEAKRWIANLERRERERTSIGSLKVGYNKVFGYYIEVSKTHVKSVPEDYIGKQTLVNAERYFTQALKEREQLILENEEKRVRLEQQTFEGLCDFIAESLPELQETLRAVAQIDVIRSLAATAKANRFRRPVVDDSRVIDVKGSRHPVLERELKEPFVPNDLYLDLDRKQFALITGPNMSGKSTFLRQVALIVILAQMGSFVPAEHARIGLVDAVFTRVGAGDRLSRGESTFLVEMKETARILDEMTDRSLVLLDEVGRGTSTYDGLSIAWAVTEYLLQGVKARPRTLFATHFHELTGLKAVFPRLFNLKITIREWEGGVVFLRKIVPGTSDRSYGIHAGRVAGLPAQVIRRAEEILSALELRRSLIEPSELHPGPGPQSSLFDLPHPPARPSSSELDEIMRRIKEFDLNASTPLDALQLLKSLQDRLGR